MPEYRITQVAQVLGVSADTVRRWTDSGRLPVTRDAAGRRIVDGRDLAELATSLGAEHQEAATGNSARNRLTGIVTRVTRDTVMAQVELAAGPFRLVSLISREAADDLALEPGVLAVGVIKATNVTVELLAAE